MTTTLSAGARALIEQPVIANVATVDKDAQPQVTPVWVDLEDGDIVFNTVRGRAKDRNLERSPYVALSIVDPADPYNVVIVRGTVEPTEAGAEQHIDDLAKKYLGVDRYPKRQPGDVRVKYRVRPDRIVAQPAD